MITAKHSDVTVVVLGLDETMEGEEPDQSNRGQAGDKASLELPGCQQRLLQAVAAVGKPVITVILSGSAMDLRYADANTNAVYRRGILAQRVELRWQIFFLERYHQAESFRLHFIKIQQICLSLPIIP